MSIWLLKGNSFSIFLLWARNFNNLSVWNFIAEKSPWLAHFLSVWLLKGVLFPFFSSLSMTVTSNWPWPLEVTSCFSSKYANITHLPSICNYFILISCQWKDKSLSLDFFRVNKPNLPLFLVNECLSIHLTNTWHFFHPNMS